MTSDQIESTACSLEVTSLVGGEGLRDGSGTQGEVDDP
jgi:hypothetical protein